VTVTSDRASTPHRDGVPEITDTIRVAFQGELGAYGEEAITQRWNCTAEPVPSATFENVVTTVADGLADFGVIPVWNSIIGDIVQGCSAVRVGRSAAHGLVVAGEVHLVVRHQLLVIPGTAMCDIDSVASHPAALAQCGIFLAANPGITPDPVYDTAGAARDLALRGSRTSAAIAGRGAAARYGLEILQADVQDIAGNVTGFLVLARPAGRHGHAPDSSTVQVLRW
jgi:prephenate dehydratase